MVSASVVNWGQPFLAWEKRYWALASFKLKRGHCYPDGPLGDWCAAQRRVRAQILQKRASVLQAASGFPKRGSPGRGNETATP